MDTGGKTAFDLNGELLAEQDRLMQKYGLPHSKELIKMTDQIHLVLKVLLENYIETSPKLLEQFHSDKNIPLADKSPMFSRMIKLPEDITNDIEKLIQGLEDRLRGFLATQN